MIHLEVETGFYRVDIDQEMRAWAQRRIDETEKLSRRQYNPGFGTYEDAVKIGYLGEAIFRKAFPHAEYRNKSHYDFEMFGVTVEVKSRRIKTMPRQMDTHIIMARQIKAAQAYALICVHESFDYGWVVGWIPTFEIKLAARFYARGQKRQDGRFLFIEDGWELCYSRTKPFTRVQLSG